MKLCFLTSMSFALPPIRPAYGLQLFVCPLVDAPLSDLYRNLLDTGRAQLAPPDGC